MQKKAFISGIILASGFGRRAHCDKLMLEWQGKGLFFQVLKQALFSKLDEVLLVIQARHEEKAKEYISLFSEELQEKIKIILNDEALEGMAASLRFGVKNINPLSQASLFLLADQIFFTAQEINRMCTVFYKKKCEILLPYYNEERKNPVLFSSKYNAELLKLSKDMGARKLIEKYADKVEKIFFDEARIFEDIDTFEAYSNLKQYEFTWANYLKNKNKISIIGAGGKSSLIWNIAKNLQENNIDCSISTTTKMWNKAPDFIEIKCIKEKSEILNYSNQSEKIPLFISKINSENKVIGFPCEYFDSICHNENQSKLIMEADGAKSKNFKIHGNSEPCIPHTSDCILAVIGMDALGKTIESQVHRFELLDAKYSKNTIITLDILFDLLLAQNGYFKHIACCEHALFLNYRESMDAYNNSMMLYKMLCMNKERLPQNFKGCIIGSNVLNSYEFFAV